MANERLLEVSEPPGVWTTNKSAGEGNQAWGDAAEPDVVAAAEHPSVANSGPVSGGAIIPH